MFRRPHRVIECHLMSSDLYTIPNTLAFTLDDPRAVSKTFETIISFIEMSFKNNYKIYRNVIFRDRTCYKLLDDH